MEHESTGDESTHQTPTTDSRAPTLGPESEDAEKRLPVADGGYGPLDSDDIEWLIESGQVWLP